MRQAALAAGAIGGIIDAPIDPECVAAAFGSEKLFRFQGEGASAFAPMSGFFAARDGWVRTHANYPHHAERLARILNLTATDKESVACALSLRSVQELEDEAAQAGVILVCVRREEDWQVSPMGHAASIGDLVEISTRDDSSELVLRSGELPLTGLRVLDMTCVLAGPVCTRTLALLGARVNAWGDHGPWSSRRGFDSIVQAASGIALIESRDATTPGALPAQALDHASGYLLASGIITALVRRADDGRGRDVRVSLARTAHELLTSPGRTLDHPVPWSPTQQVTVSHGDLTTVRSALPGFDDYPFPSHPWGSDTATWS